MNFFQKQFWCADAAKCGYVERQVEQQHRGKGLFPDVGKMDAGLANQVYKIITNGPDKLVLSTETGKRWLLHVQKI